MTSKISLYQSKKTNVVLFLLSLVTFGYWMTSNSINVYQFPITGAMFELLWLPMLAFLLLIPIGAIMTLIKQKALLDSLSFYAGLLIALTVILLLSHN